MSSHWHWTSYTAGSAVRSSAYSLSLSLILSLSFFFSLSLSLSFSFSLSLFLSLSLSLSLSLYVYSCFCMGMPTSISRSYFGIGRCRASRFRSGTVCLCRVNILGYSKRLISWQIKRLIYKAPHIYTWQIKRLIFSHWHAHAKLRARTHEASDSQKPSTHNSYLVQIPEHLFLRNFVRVLRRCIAKGTQSEKCYLMDIGEGMMTWCSM